MLMTTSSNTNNVNISLQTWCGENGGRELGAPGGPGGGGYRWGYEPGGPYAPGGC